MGQRENIFLKCFNNRYTGRVAIGVGYSQELEEMLISSGIEVNPFIRGSIDDIIAAYCHGSLRDDRFFLPGCRRKGRGRGPGRGRSQSRRGMRRGRFN